MNSLYFVLYKKTKEIIRKSRITYYREKYGIPDSSWLGNVYIRSKNFKIGENSYINSGYVLNGASDIEIGDHCCIGYNVSLISETHDVDNPTGEDKNRDPLVIGDYVWIGNNVVVLPGVEIGDNTVIGANSVVTRDIPSNCVAVGSPCKVVREKC